MIIRMTGDEFDAHQIDVGKIEIGSVYTIVEYHKEESPSAGWYRLRPGDTGGISGNMDPSIKRYHGWRGTSNGTVKTACGLREVTKIEHYKNGNYKITLGDDLKADEE